MIKYFSNILGITFIPRWLLLHLMFFSLALGGFQAIITIGAISEFVSSGMIVLYPEAIAFSGLLGIILFNFYRYMVKNFSYRKALLFYFLVIIFILFLAIFLPVIFPQVTSSVMLFVIFIPVTLIVEQFITGLSDKIPFQKYQQNIKRLTETIYLGGSVLFSILITFLVIYGFKLFIFIPSLVLLLIAAIESNYILRKFEVKKNRDQEEIIDSIISVFSEIPLKINILSIAAFIFLSVFNLICVDYIFIENLNKSFENKTELVSFVGIFFASLMIITLLFKLFVYQNLIKTFRINKALYISPFIMLGAMILLNLLTYTENSPAGTSLTFLFLTIIFVRFFAYILRESFELNSLKMLLSAISLYSQKNISNTILALFSIWGYLFCGLFLLFIMSFDIFKTNIILLLNTGFGIIWIISSFLLNNRYSVSLLKIINKLSHYTPDNTAKKTLSFKERVMITTNLSGLKYLLNFQRYYQPFDFEKNIKDIPSNMQDKLGINNGMINPYEYSNHLHEPAKFQTGQTSTLNYYDSDVSLKLTDIENLSSSGRIKDRIRAVQMIKNSHNFSYSGIFKMLIRDMDDEVKRNAIMASVSFYNSEILFEIVKYISHEEFATLVSEIFTKIGDDALPILTQVFYRTETDIKIQAKILKIIGNIATAKALDFLVDKLNYPNKWIIKETVSALIENNIQSDFKNNPLLNNAIIKTINVIAWLLAKELSLESISKNEPLKKALDDEYQLTFNLLFNLLQLKYQNGIIEYINYNFHQQYSNEQKELYTELLAHIVDEDIRSRLFPLLHNNQLSEKVDQLKRFYPIGKSDVRTALKDLVNADYEYIGIWTRACAIKLLIEMEDDLHSEEIIAQVYNPELMIAELAFFGIYKKKPQDIELITSRLPAKLKNRIVSVLKKGPLYEYSLTFNKVLTLQKISYFQKMMGHYLVPFAEILSEIYLSKNESTYLKCSDEEVLPVFFEPYGNVSLIDAHKRKVRLNQNYLYGLGLYAGGITIEAFSDSVIYIAQPEQIGYLVIHYEELSDALFKYIQNSNFY